MSFYLFYTALHVTFTQKCGLRMHCDELSMCKIDNFTLYDRNCYANSTIVT